MKKNILSLIREASVNQDTFNSLEKIYTLNEQLQYASNLHQVAEDIYAWLIEEFNIDNIVFSLFDIEKEEKEIILSEGDDFFLDDDLSKYFIINTHTNINAVVSFCTTSRVHQQIIDESFNIIEFAFFQISPIVQSAILKKNFVQSQSIDSVTNVYNRQYLTTHVQKLLDLSGDKRKHQQMHFLMIEIDRFKAVSDEFDFDIADKVLIELAKVIHANIYEFDIVARITGDQFLISTFNHSLSEINQLCENIIKEFSQLKIPVDLTGNFIQKTISIGINEYKENQKIDEGIKESSIALDEAKNIGRSQFKNFEDLTEEDSLELF